MDCLEVEKVRGDLPRLRRALAGNRLKIGFMGGSITDSRAKVRWADELVAWLLMAYPDLRLTVENEAIGATGSALAAFMAKPCIADKGCDIVFVEYAVNDMEVATETRNRSREGVIRQLLRGNMDVVIVYTYHQDMYPEMISGQVPPSIAEFEAIAAHYHLSSVWMGLYALRTVMQGGMRWETWLPDRLHPESRGSHCYAQSVTAFLQKILLRDTPPPGEAALPAPLNGRCWEHTSVLPFERVGWKAPWTLRRWHLNPVVDDFPYALNTVAPGARIRFAMNGRGLVLGLDFNSYSADIKYRIDGGAWVVVHFERQAWCAETGMFKVQLVCDEMDEGIHNIEIETLHGGQAECRGTNCAIMFIGVIA